MARGHAKGSAFERLICKQLSMWWTGGVRDDVFWRSSNSGGRAKVRGRQGRQTFGQYGDVQATDPIGQQLIDFCTIEIKRGYKHHAICDLLDKPAHAAKQQCEAWLEQANTDHEAAGSIGYMLITQRDRKAPLVTISYTCYCMLKRHSKLGKTVKKLRPSAILKANRIKLFVTSLSAFLDWVTPNAIKDIIDFHRDAINEEGLQRFG
jgi:hypothetical protein